VVSEWNGTKVSAIANSGSLLWSLPLQQGDLTTLALAEINQGKRHSINIVVGSLLQRVNLIDGNGHLIWTFDAKANVLKTAFGVLSGGGKKEIAAASILGGIAAINAGTLFLNSEGKLIRFLGAEPSTSSPFPQIPQRGFRDLVVVDLDGDGIDEVVAISDDEFVYALSMRKN
jgi:hypothetical protein